MEEDDDEQRPRAHAHRLQAGTSATGRSQGHRHLRALHHRSGHPRPARARTTTEGRLGLAETRPERLQKLALFKDRKGERDTWPRLVYDDLKRTIPAELMVEIDGIGALQTGDRADVAQIIMSIEAVLNGLDRAIKIGRRDIVEAIVPKQGRWRRESTGARNSRQPRRRRLARHGCASFRRSARRC